MEARAGQINHAQILRPIQEDDVPELNSNNSG